MKKINCFFVIVAIISQAFMTSIVFANPERYDKNVINIDFMRNLITTENCEKNLKNFVGCIESLTELLNASIDTNKKSKSWILESSDVLAEYNKKSRQKTFGFLVYNEVELNKEIDLAQKNQTPFQDLAALRISRLREFYQKLYGQALQSKNKPYQLILKDLERESKVNPSLLNPEVLAAAINMYLMNAVDPHSTIVAEKSFMESLMAKGESRMGVGMQFRLSILNGQIRGLRVTDTFDHSPAKKAGLKKGDLILQIDELVLAPKTLDAGIKRLSDSSTKTVEITFQRGEEQKTIQLEKASYKIDNVSELTFQFGGKLIGYARLGQFQLSLNAQGIPQDCVDLAETFHRFQRYTDGAILDLRDNGGGSVEAAICIAGILLGGGVNVAVAKKIEHTFFPPEIMSLFLTGKQIHQMGEAENETHIYNTDLKIRKINDKPLMVLVNNRSASSSEMLAAALRDHNRAYIVGTTTFGKGTTMSPVAKTKEPNLISTATDMTEKMLQSIPEKRLMILGTDYQFYSPKGQSHHGQGITPLITAYLGVTPNPFEQSKRRESDLFMFPISVPPLKINRTANSMNTLIPDYGCISDAKLADYYQSLDEAADEKDMQILTAAQQIICLYNNIPKDAPAGAYPLF